MKSKNSFNASVVTDSINSGGVEVLGDDVTQAAVYDWARFYIRVSNLAGNVFYDLAYNTTGLLGRDTGNNGVVKAPSAPAPNLIPEGK